MDFSMLNKLLPPPLTNPFYRTPGEALDAVIRPIQEQTGIPGSYQYIEQGLQKLLQPKTPMQRAQVGQPMILGGRLGYKAADGSWQPRGDMESENIPQYVQGRGYFYDEPRTTGQPEKESEQSAPAVVLDPNAAKNRAYQQERARVEAMVKANPDMQKQEIADARAKVRDMGMATWAAANPELAKNLQPGQVGYDAVQQALIGNEAGEAMRQGYGLQMPQQVVMTPPPGVNSPQGLATMQSFGGEETYGPQGLQVDPEMAKKFQALLNQTKA